MVNHWYKKIPKATGNMRNNNEFDVQEHLL